VYSHARPQSAEEVLLLNAIHNLINGEVFSIRVFAMEQRNRDKYLISDPDKSGCEVL